MDVCGLYDLGFEGRNWTFEKKVAGGSYCRVRLDPALATADWCTRFPMARVTHLTAAASDHDPIMLRWQQVSGRKGRKKKKIFRYEMMWEAHDQLFLRTGVSRGDLHVFMAKLKLLNATKHGIC